MSEKVTEDVVRKMIKFLAPFYKKEDFVQNEVEYTGYGYACNETELFIYSKLRTLLLGKLSQSIFGGNITSWVSFGDGPDSKSSFGEDIQLNNNLLTWRGCTLYEAMAEFFYENSGFPSGGPFFWKDSFALFGGQITEPEDLLDFYLTDLDYLDADHDVKCTTLEEYSKVDGYSSAIESIKGWWKKPYQEEMTLALIKDVYSVLGSMSDQEEFMDYCIQCNVAIVPFLNFFKKAPTDAFDKKVVRLAKKMIKELETPNLYFPWCLQGLQSGYTKNLFFNITATGQAYDSTLWAECISLKAEIAFYTLDFLLAYLDMKYDYLPKEIKSYYL